MSELAEIAISDLLLDHGNARLGQEQTSQQDTCTELAKLLGRQLITLSEDIVKNGTDPTTLVAVVPTGDRLKRYRVIEGNRRVLALKALETPSLVQGALPPTEQTKLQRLSSKYLEHPATAIQCVLFDNEAEALHWVELRHTGANDGVGIMPWGANEQDRFKTRHGGARKPAGQILDFVEHHGNLGADAKPTGQRRGVITNVERLLVSREARDALGIDVIDNQVVSLYPMAEIVKGLSWVVEQFRSGQANVHDVYYAKDRVKFVDEMPRARRPKGKRLTQPVVLSTLDQKSPTKANLTPSSRRQKRRQPRRTAIVPASCSLNIGQPRINKIYNELSSLDADSYPNACAVLLRVFVELSTDHKLDAERAMTRALRSDPLAKRLKGLAAHLRKRNIISEDVKRAIDVVTTRRTGPLAASTTTMNQYVHNPHVNPTAAELQAAWDELQPLLEKIWP